MINVVNKRKHRGPSLYIGRPSSLGNPYVIGEDGDRGEVIAKYETWLSDQYPRNTKVRQSIDEIYHLYKSGIDVNLCCWCAPAKCHGDVIKKFVEELP